MALTSTVQPAFSSTTAEEEKPARYKAPSARAGNKGGTPWQTKRTQLPYIPTICWPRLADCWTAHTMGNGKDFFLDLRKQISALQHSERAGG